MTIQVTEPTNEGQEPSSAVEPTAEPSATTEPAPAAPATAPQVDNQEEFYAQQLQETQELPEESVPAEPSAAPQPSPSEPVASTDQTDGTQPVQQTQAQGEQPAEPAAPPQEPQGPRSVEQILQEMGLMPQGIAPAQPEQGQQPVQPEQQTQPVQPAQPTQPVQPVQQPQQFVPQPQLPTGQQVMQTVYDPQSQQYVQQPVQPAQPVQPVQPTPEQIRAQHIETLANEHYKLDDQTVEKLTEEGNENLAQMLPAMAATVFVDAVQATMQQIQSMLPAVLTQHTQQLDESKKLEQAFYQFWQDRGFDLSEHSNDLSSFGRFYWQNNPQGTVEDCISQIGAQLIIAKQLQPTAAVNGQQGGQPQSGQVQNGQTQQVVQPIQELNLLNQGQPFRTAAQPSATQPTPQVGDMEGFFAEIMSET